MPRAAPKKRSRAENTAGVDLRRSRRLASNSQAAHARGENDAQANNTITLRNQRNSPLLGLPAELRERIWTYAFGNRTVHPISSRTKKKDSVGRITYHPCRERLSDQEVYNLSLQGAADDDPVTWAANGLDDHRTFAGTHHCNPDPDNSFPFLTENLVCKQMWCEAEPIKWRTTTIYFSDSIAFKDFIKTPSAKKHLIQELTINPLGWSKSWEAALTRTAVGTFVSLQGLHLIFDMRVGYSGYEGFNTLNEVPMPLLRRLIPQFQKLRLRDERTTVWITGGRATFFTPSGSVCESREFAEGVRRLLLQYQPTKKTGKTAT